LPAGSRKYTELSPSGQTTSRSIATPAAASRARQVHVEPLQLLEVRAVDRSLEESPCAQVASGVWCVSDEWFISRR
jgi:hypothetical protein